MKGFTNIGNTCYMNAGLQMLIQNKDLCKLLQNNSLLFSDNEILKTIGDFINRYYDNSNNNMIPADIKKIVENKNTMFKGNKQHDSIEFIICLLDIIDTEIKKYPKIVSIESVFGIQINTRIKCKYMDCLTIYNNKELNNFLLFNIKPEFTCLDDLYRDFKTNEKLDGDNKYYCTKCKLKQQASKRMEIVKWSNNLLIWIKRFNQNGNMLTKNSQEINIPIIWRHNMTLMGAIIHSGGLNGGHYFYVGQYDSNWYLFNDSKVSIINMNELNKYLNIAYLLYYKKISE